MNHEDTKNTKERHEENRITGGSSVSLTSSRPRVWKVTTEQATPRALPVFRSATARASNPFNGCRLGIDPAFHRISLFAIFP